MKAPQQRVCVIVPAYNEGQVIADVISQAKKQFSKSKYDIDILVVNDGSKDNTTTEALGAGAIVVDHILNSGAGGATATGLRYAEKNNYTVAATMDADGQHSPLDVIEGIEEIQKQKADLLIGSRLINSEGMSKVKVLGNRGLSFITFLIFGISSSDSQSGLRIYSERSIKNLRWKTTSYEFCSEMLWRARQANLKVGEYPIQAIYTDYSKSKGQNNWNAINIIKSLLKRRVMELFG